MAAPSKQSHRNYGGLDNGVSDFRRTRFPVLDTVRADQYHRLRRGRRKR